MRNIFHIYKEDMKSIFTNYAALIVILALCILPSLYAWFNIKASWDPYGQEATHGIKIGVVNQDAGTTLNDVNVNIGNTIVEELKKNKQLGWQFVDKETALDAIENGTYYAMITIPYDFSSNLTSIISSDIRKGDIIYTVNEKINAIAPKLTDKGVTSLQQMISKTVVETVSNTIFDIANKIGVNLEEQIPNVTKAEDTLVTIQGKFKDMDELVDNTDNGLVKLKKLLASVNSELPKIKETIQSSKELGKNAKTFLTTSKSMADEIGPVMKQDLLVIQGVIGDVTGGAEALQEALQGNLENAPELIAQLKSKVGSLHDMTDSLTKVLDSLNQLSAKKPFDEILSKLTSVSDKLNSMASLLDKVEQKVNQGDTFEFPELTKFINAGNSISSIIGKLVDAFDTTIVPQLTKVFEQANGVADNVIGILDDAEEKLPDVKKLITIATTSADQGKEGLEYVKTILPRAKELVNDIVAKLDEVNKDNGLQHLVDLLKADVTSRSEFLATPVDIIEEKLFPIENYGTGMTPFYTVLCLWVGILLLVSILSVNAHGEYKPYQVYFGKLALFISISFIQGMIVSLGDLYLLKIYCVNPVLFVLGNLLVCVTFTLIVYSLVSVFGNVGKVFGIILLVLQVAGSGGTFPIQLTPVFFQRLNPYLPFTYGISFAREAIGGVVKEVLIKDIIILCSFIGISLIVALALKGVINKLLRPFVDRFNESKLGEH